MDQPEGPSPPLPCLQPMVDAKGGAQEAGGAHGAYHLSVVISGLGAGVFLHNFSNGFAECVVTLARA